MTMSVKTETQKTAGPQECAGCGKKIQDRYLLKALDMYWHEDCLKCGCCDCRLGEVGSTLFTKGNLILCKRDYLRLFGTTGYCAACNKVIPAFEMVMRARTNVYHLECFACQQCNHRFCVGDRFFLCDNKILCEYDYEERMVFANLAYNSNNLAQMKNQARNSLPAPPATSTAAGTTGPPPPPANSKGPPPPGPPPPHLGGPSVPPPLLPQPPPPHSSSGADHLPLPPHSMSNGMLPPPPPYMNGHNGSGPLPGMGMMPPPPVSSSSSSSGPEMGCGGMGRNGAGGGPLPPTSASSPLPAMSASGPPLPPMVS